MYYYLLKKNGKINLKGLERHQTPSVYTSKNMDSLTLVIYKVFIGSDSLYFFNYRIFTGSRKPPFFQFTGTIQSPFFYLQDICIFVQSPFSTGY